MGKKKKDPLSEGQREEVEEWVDAHDDTAGWYEAGRQDRMKEHLGHTYSAAGDRESDLETEGEVVLSPLLVTDETRKENKGQIGKFTDAFNLYCIPMSRTLSAVGRVQDLLSSGAPGIPKELAAEERQQLHLLKDGDSEDHHAKRDYQMWRDSNRDAQESLTDYMGLMRELMGAQKRWRSVKTILEIRTKEKMLHAKEGELARLQVVHDLAVGAVGVIEDTVETFTGVSEAKGVWEMAKAVKRPEEFSISSIVGEIVFRIGDKDAIDNTIAFLNKEIKDLGINKENLDIEAAGDSVAGIDKQQLAAASRVSHHSANMRENAMLFAQGVGGEDTDISMATMIAEAYQELRLFGEEANTRARGLKKYLPAVADMVYRYQNVIDSDRVHANDVDNARIAGDATEVLRAGAAVKRYGGLLGRELKDWEHKEALWTGFFDANYGNDKKGRKKALAGD